MFCVQNWKNKIT